MFRKLSFVSSSSCDIEQLDDDDEKNKKVTDIVPKKHEPKSLLGSSHGSLMNEKKDIVRYQLETVPCSNTVLSATQANGVLRNYIKEPNTKVKHAIHLLYSLSKGEAWELRTLRNLVDFPTHLCYCIRFFEPTRNLVVSALWLARNISRDEGMRNIMMRPSNNIWPLTMSVLSLYKADREVVAACISVLHNTADHGLCEDHWADNAVLSSMKRHGDDSGVVLLSCGALTRFSQVGVAVIHKMKKDAADDVVVNVMKRHQGREDVFERACRFLRSLYSDAREHSCSDKATVDNVTGLIKQRHGDVFWCGKRDVLASVRCGK